jgi:DNA polymerase I
MGGSPVTFAVDVRANEVVRWSREGDGVSAERDPVYSASMYVGGDADVLAALRRQFAPDAAVADTGYEEWFRSLRDGDRSTVLRIDVHDPWRVRDVAERVRTSARERAPPGAVQCYNVDVEPAFRYCVETGTNPTPDDDLRMLTVSLDERSVVDGDVTALEVDGEAADDGDERAALSALAAALRDVDPDVLVVAGDDLLPLLDARATALGVDVPFGRDAGVGGEAGVVRLAGENSYEQYGTTRYSPARYDVTGRAVVDARYSFLWAEASLDGLLCLVERSWLPLQAAARSSIGGVLTAAAIREALRRDVLVPWHPRRPERFKSVGTLHAADRGGHIRDPEMGFHEDVVAVDFASLYPRLICRDNLSPETVRCDCHDGSDVTEVGYSVCDDPGFLPAVLRPFLDARARAKERLAAATTDDERRRFRRQSGALKWVLVACYGYQGYRNAKFGRIECHEAVNALAREALLDAKEAFERGGWRVVHGVVDSLWVTAESSTPTPIEDLTVRVSDAVGVPLEIEARYDWVCFVPTADGRRGALTKSFGKIEGSDEFDCRGVELCRRDTCAFVAEAQRDLLRTLDRSRDPDAVADRLRFHRRRLRAGDADRESLVRRTRLSKDLEKYATETLAVAAARRAERRGLDRRAGEDVRYVVADDDASGPGRVRLPFEEVDRVDTAYYEERLARAATTVLSPFGWDRPRLDRRLRREGNSTLAAFE